MQSCNRNGETDIKSIIDPIAGESGHRRLIELEREGVHAERLQLIRKPGCVGGKRSGGQIGALQAGKAGVLIREADGEMAGAVSQGPLAVERPEAIAGTLDGSKRRAEAVDESA